MHVEYIILIGRGLERLLIVGASYLLVILGYRLFRIGIETAQNAEIKTGLFAIRLQSVAPGVFFAVLGTVLLFFGVTTQLNMPQQNANDQESLAGQSGHIVWYNRPSGEDDMQLIAEQKHMSMALSRILAFCQEPDLTEPAAHVELERATKIVENLRNDILRTGLNVSHKQVLDALASIRSGVPIDDIDKQEQSLIESVSEWTAESF